MQKKIFAVVVTYKRAEILSEYLKAILIFSTKKVDRLHIVVNSDDIETIDAIKKFLPSSEVKITYEIFDNVGPAGGFFYGLESFLRSECNYVWLMDDDVIPENDCLENLLKYAEKHPYIFPKVLKPSGEEIEAFGWWGVFISRNIVEKVGLPIKEFFYWTEDTEYLQNRIMRKHQILPFRCEEAVVTHLHNRNEIRPGWFYYYTIRNTFYYRLNLFPLNFKGRLMLLKMILRLGYRIMLKEPDKLEKIKNLFIGLYHGYKGKLGKVENLH